MKHLALEPAIPLTNDGLDALVAAMPQLESLRLSDCCLLTQVAPLTQLLQLTSLTVTVSPPPSSPPIPPTHTKTILV